MLSKTALLFATCIRSSLPFACRRLSSSVRRRYPILPSMLTPYTINDEVCAPTDEAELRKVVHNHCRTLDTFSEKRPIAKHTHSAFRAVREELEQFSPQDDPSVPRKIILDSGCGTGRSTLLLGERYPDHTVIGIDRSFVRLNKNTMKNNEVEDPSEESRRPFQAVSSNVLLVRAELTDFWRCCLGDNWQVTRHCILYPNPYPKKARLKRRFYAHPSFPLILGLGGDIVVRSNWEGYLREFAKSVVYANEYYEECGEEGSKNLAKPYLEQAMRGPVERTDKTVAWTNFEKKYDDIGEPTYELVLNRSDT